MKTSQCHNPTVRHDALTHPAPCGGVHASLRNDTGFTIIELLVVIAIIAALAALGAVAYSGIRGDAQKRETVSTLQTLSNAYTEFYASTDRPIRSEEAGARPPQRTDLYNSFDEELAMDWFLYEAWWIDESRGVLRSLDDRLIFHPNDPSRDGPPVAVEDAWENPIAYRGPAYDEQDANDDSARFGFSVPPHPRAFFISPGPSGDFGNADDNIYSYQEN